jgi:large subunit ribosomal protein L19
MITSIEKAHIRSDIPEFRAGDTLRIAQKIKEGDKERAVSFEGLVIARKHGTGPSATFTVRKVIDGIGVERIFPLHSPLTTKITVVRRAKVRRAKLYYIREKAAREVRRKMKSIYQEVPKAEEAAAETPVATPEQ